MQHLGFNCLKSHSTFMWPVAGLQPDYRCAEKETTY